MKSPKPAPRSSKSADKKTAKASVKLAKPAAKKAAKPATKYTAKSSAKPEPKSSLKKTVGRAVKKTVKAVTSRVSKAVAKIKKKVAAKRPEKSASAKTIAPEKTSAKPSANVATKAAAKVTAKVPVKASPKAPAKTPASAKRPKAFAPRDVARGFGFPADAPELPELYGEDRLVLMAKDPEYLFAYWEVTPELQAEGRKAMLQGEEYREALRLNWNARDLFDANYLLLPVTHAARKWYMRVPFSGIAYHVEIGWLSNQGHFISLLTSNASDAPESWVATRHRLKALAGASADSVLARTLKAGRPQGSSENAPVHVEKLAMPVPGDWNFKGPGSTGSSSGSISAKSAVKNKRAG